MSGCIPGENFAACANITVESRSCERARSGAHVLQIVFYKRRFALAFYSPSTALIGLWSELCTRFTWPSRGRRPR